MNKINKKSNTIFSKLFFFSLGFLMILISVAGFHFGTKYLDEISQDLPSLEQLENYDPQLVTKIYSADGKLIKEIFTHKRALTPLKEIPQVIQDAVLATEDRKFYEHWGIDLKRLFGAFFANLTTLQFRQGASTLTQQLARNLFLTREKTITRKLKELLTSLQIEKTYSKEEILEMYLNTVYFGHGAYGIQEAVKKYFHKTLSQVTPEEAALLAGQLKAPTHYSPLLNPERALQRRNTVLFGMNQAGFLPDSVYRAVRDLPIIHKVAEVAEDDATYGEAPYFTEFVRQQLEKKQSKLGVNIYEDGLKVYSTVDSRLQDCAEKAVAKHLPEIEERTRAITKSEKYVVNYLEQFHPELKPDSVLRHKNFLDSLVTKDFHAQTALVALDHKTGKILAMVGGRDFTKTKFNRAVQAVRQPGSVFKTVLYTSALDNGVPINYRLLNQPIAMFMPDGSRWTPQNYDHSIGGLTTLREALKRSLNLISVRLAVQKIVPPKEVVSYAKRLGVKSRIPPFDAIALGAVGILPIEAVGIYGTIANQGVYTKPYSIEKIEDRFGNTMETTYPESREALSKETAYLMTNLLEGVVNGGTATSLRYKFNFQRPAAGKTGTTNEFTDAWFVGFIPQFTAGVWVGFDDPKKTLGRGQAGGKVALPIWADFMNCACDTLQLPQEEFVVPAGITEVEICSETFDLPTKLCPLTKEIYNSKFLPTATCKKHSGIRQSGRKAGF